MRLTCIQPSLWLLLRLLQGQLCPLTTSDTFTFGASTRSYSIQLPHHTAAASTAGKKRGRVTFAEQDDDELGVAANDGNSGKRQSLEQVWVQESVLDS